LHHHYADYYPKALTLFKSIRKFNSDISLQVLVADNQPISPQFQMPAGISVIAAGELNEYPLVYELHRKYAHIHMNFSMVVKASIYQLPLRKRISKNYLPGLRYVFL
jgi:hypothetical protein